MADGIELNAGAGGATVAADDIVGTHYQINKLAHGALDSATIVSTASGLPVQQQGNWTIQPLPAGDNNIGNVDVLTLPALPTGDNNIGNIDVASLPVGSIAAATERTADYDSGGGTVNTTLVGVALPGAGGPVAGGTATNPLRTDPTGTTIQPVSGTVTANGAALEATLDARTGSLTEAAPGTDTASAGLNGRLQRIAQRLTSLIALLPAALVSGRLDVNVGAVPVTVSVEEKAGTAGGTLGYDFLSTAAVLAASIKGSAGKVYSMQFFNNGANEVFVRLYNQAGAPVGGDTANIVWRGMVPGNLAGAGFTVTFPAGFADFTSGIGIRVTGAVADSDTTVLAANEVMGNVQYG